MPLSDHCNSPRLPRDALGLGPSAALSVEILLQLPVSTTLLKQSHNYEFHSNPQHLNLQLQEQGFSRGWQRELLPLKGHQQGPSTSQSGSYLRNGAEKNSVDFSTPSVKQLSDFFMCLYQHLNRRPSTIDGSRMANVDTLGPVGHNIS